MVKKKVFQKLFIWRVARPIWFDMLLVHHVHSAVNAENGEINKVKNQTTGTWGTVPDTARKYKVPTYVKIWNSLSKHKEITKYVYVCTYRTWL